jgi:putative membrane protein
MYGRRQRQRHGVGGSGCGTEPAAVAAARSRRQWLRHGVGGALAAAAPLRTPCARAIPIGGDTAAPAPTPATEVDMSLLLSWLILSLAVWITAMVLPGFHVRGIGSAIVVAAIFGILNFLLGWLFFTVFTIATLGLAWLLAFITRWIINAILLKITDALTDHLTIDGFRWALIGALMMSALGTVGEWLIRS